MQHGDPEILALAALGEQIPPEDAAHLAGCDQCTADVAELVELVTLGRESPPMLPPVPDAIWDGVRQELGMGRDTTAGPPGPGTTDEAPSAEVGQVVRMRPHEAPRRRGRIVAVAGVAATVGALLGGTVVWAVLDRDAPTVAETVLAQAVLDPLSSTVSTPGEAQVLDTSDGLVVRVDARGLPPGSGFHEVWLLDADATKLVSLGALPSGSVGTFTVPPGVRMEDFPVVDISLEPYDGDPSHSQDSLLRGTLRT